MYAICIDGDDELINDKSMPYFQISYTYGPYGNERAISFGPYQQFSLPGVDAVVGEQIY